MKQGWEIKKLGKVCRYVKEQGYYSGLPYIGMEDIESGTSIFTGSLTHKKVNSSTFRFRSGFVLFGRLRPYLRKILIAPFEGHCSTEIFPIQTTDALKPEFLKYWFMLDSTVFLVNNTCTGARMPRANMKDVLNFDIPVPSISEQERIVGILDNTFAKIEALRASAEQNLKNAKDLFQASLKQEFTPRQSWVVKRFDEVCVLQRGFDLPTHSRFTGRYPLVSSNGITDNINQYKVKAPGVVTGRSGTIGNVHYIEKDFWPLNTALYIKEFYGNNEKCIYYFLLSFDLDKYSSGTGVPTLNRNNVHGNLVSFPNSIAEQKSIVKKLDALSERCRAMEENYRQTLTACDKLKQALLKKAFNGEL